MPRILFKMTAAAVAVLLAGCTPAQPPSQPPTTSPTHRLCPVGTVESNGDAGLICLSEEEAEQARKDRAAQQQKVIREQEPQANRVTEGLSAKREEYEGRFSTWVARHFPRAKDSNRLRFDYFCAEATDQQLAASGVLGRWPYVVNSSDGTVRVEGGVSERTIAALREACVPQPLSGG